MIAAIDPIAGNGPTISSREALLGVVAEVVRLKLQHASLTADMEREVTGVQKRYAPRLDRVAEDIHERESAVQDYCERHRAELFPEKKSIEMPSAVIGFEITPWRVETSSRKVTWKNVVERLLKLAWGKAYLRVPNPQPDKEALLSDREKLTPEQTTSAGVTFTQDEQFFLRPKSQIVEATDGAKV